MNFIVSTDLDGTLLDHFTYSFSPAQAGLDKCAELGIPVVLNTSKTYSEVISLQTSLGLDSPLIVENGSALIASKSHWLGLESNTHIELENRNDDYQQLVFGVKRARILDFIKKVRMERGWNFEGFSDWNVEQISQHTGLDQDSAAQASKKEFSEPFIWHDTPEALQELIKLATSAQLTVLRGGRFYHLQGKTDKAKPLKWLKADGASILKLKHTGKLPLKLICLGDSDNDVAMLNSADYAVCVRSPAASFPTLAKTSQVFHTEGFGPVGWSESILSILS